ncbi:hypothetical protein AB6A40_000676 [Gnathostoma spinigerum]|uniref:PWWP domain-containing protein n=1 Tax=Gnathostoma spinigerum TaxID=75299 RepID=A0ABD6EBA9_9BILA
MAAFKSGDLVWAKMKGFPPWPAKIMQSSSQLTDMPAGRYSVMFFGTHETAIMKSCDLFNYLECRSQFEVSRKAKGFNKGIEEIRNEAALLEVNAMNNLLESSMRLSPIPTRKRRSTSKFSKEDFLAEEQFSRKRTRSDSSRRSRTSSVSPGRMKFSQRSVKTERSCDRKRLDSFGSNGGRRRKNSRSPGCFDFDQFDTSADPGFSPMLSDGVFNSLLDNLEMDLDLDPTSKSKRTTKKIFDDFISAGKTPPRERHNSTASSTSRTRLISGMSDVFEEFFESAQAIFNPAELLSAIDDLPSEDDRPATPEEPLPMPAPTKLCSDCGCQCELYGLKWRCTSKQCMKWNGTHDPYGINGELSLPNHTDTVNSFVGTTNNGITAPSNSAAFASGSSSVKKEQHSSSPTFTLSKMSTMPSNISLFSTHSNSSVVDKNLDLEAAGRATLPSEGALSSAAAINPIINREKRNTRLNVFSMIPPPTTSTNQSITRTRPSVPRRQNGTGRPKSYKVEKTPPVSANGQRHCSFCNGQVRPQMCGGNKHRWRCVDKKCRKWYGWVKSNEEIPKDLGKKGRWKDLALKIKRKRVPSDETSDDGTGVVETTVSNPPSNSIITNAVPLCEKQPKKIGRPPKNLGKVKLKGLKSSDGKDEASSVERPKRKYKKREKKTKDQKATTSVQFTMTAKEYYWQPSAMERRTRWWTNEKRRVDVSPERELGLHAFDVPATFRLLATSMRAAAATKADEPGTVSGTLDLLMDSLMGVLGPLLSLTAKVPQFAAAGSTDKEFIQRLWNASAVHTPIFS